MIKYMVTGGVGFIGSHLVEELSKDINNQILIIDKRPLKEAGIEFNKRQVIFRQCDISNFSELRECFKWFRSEYIFHLAAEARIQPSFENPDGYFRSNVLGPRNILKLSREFGVKRVVYSASSSAYGEQNEMPLREDMALAPLALHPYGSTKRIGEMLMSDMGRLTGGPETVSLRYFNVYGPRQPTEGEYATVVGIFLRQLKDEKPLTVVMDGYQRRDFTYVSDIVRANILAMFSQRVGNAEILNIGTGKSYSVWDVARVVLGIPFRTAPVELLEAKLCRTLLPRRGEVRETLADISKAKKLLEWEPSVSFKEGIELTKKEYFS